MFTLAYRKITLNKGTPSWGEVGERESVLRVISKCYGDNKVMAKICQRSPRGGRTRNLFLCVPARTQAHTRCVCVGGDGHRKSTSGSSLRFCSRPSPTPSRVSGWTWTSPNRLHRLASMAAGICLSPAGGLQVGTTIPGFFTWGLRIQLWWWCFCLSKHF